MRILRLGLFILLMCVPFAATASVRCVQENLVMFGYDPGPVDGVFGRRTAETFANFNQDYSAGLPAFSPATAERVCAEFTAFAKGAGGVPIDPANLLPPADSQTETPLCYA